MTQINQTSRSFRKISSIDRPMFVNSVFHQFNNSISSDLFTLFDSFNLALSHSLDIFDPRLLLSTELILNFPGLILSLLTLGNYFVDYNVNMHPINLNLILLPIKFLIDLQEKLLSTKSSHFTDIQIIFHLSM